MATTMPISTNTTIAICIQIQNGDMAANRVVGRLGECRRPPAGARLSCRDGGTRAHVARGRRTRRVARPRRLLLSLALALCAAAWLAPASRGAAGVGAHSSATAPLGGREPGTGVPQGQPGQRGSGGRRCARPPREGRACRSALVGTRAARAESDRLTRPRGRRSPDERCRGGRHRGDCLVESTPCWASSAPAPLLKACAAVQASKANSWPPRDPATYAAFVGFPRPALWHELAAIEVWNEPDQANQNYFAGPEKPQRYAAILRAAYPAIKQADPAMPVLAGSLVGSNGALPACPLRRGHQGLLRRPVGPLLQPHARLAARDP